MSFLTGAINSVADYGKLNMEFSIIISIIIGIVAIGVLIWLLTSYEKNYKTVEATVLSSDCNNISTKNGEISTGLLNIQLPGTKSPVNISGASNCSQYQPNQKIKVKYNPNNMEQRILIASQDPKTLFIGITIAVLIFCILNIAYQYYFRNNKVAETVAGGTSIVQSIKSVF